MSKKIPKYIQVKEKIKQEIKVGNLTDKLPGERVIAQKLDVAYMTVRKAVSELQEEGILHKSTTKGTYVSHRRMSPKKTNNLGFFLDNKIREGISSPYYSLIFKALEESARKAGYNLLLYSKLEDINPLKNEKKIDGVIACCFPRIEKNIQVVKKFLPLVLLDNIASDKSIPSVTIDNFNSCRIAAEYLISLKHSRIAFISGLLDSDVCKDRFHGYLSALNAAEIPENDQLIYKGDYSYQSGEQAARHFLSQPLIPTAIMCANDSMAIGAMKVIQQKGFRIPQDISVIGFDDIEVASRIYPALTTNKAPIQKIASQTITLIIDAINGANLDYQHIILPAELITRESTAPIQYK